MCTYMYELSCGRLSWETEYVLRPPHLSETSRNAKSQSPLVKAQDNTRKISYIKTAVAAFFNI
jgi:hypothetical protein